MRQLPDQLLDHMQSGYWNLRNGNKLADKGLGHIYHRLLING